MDYHKNSYGSGGDVDNKDEDNNDNNKVSDANRWLNMGQDLCIETQKPEVTTVIPILMSRQKGHKDEQSVHSQ